jgi:hypothetical protein
MARSMAPNAPDNLDTVMESTGSLQPTANVANPPSSSVANNEDSRSAPVEMLDELEVDVRLLTSLVITITCDQEEPELWDLYG